MSINHRVVSYPDPTHKRRVSDLGMSYDRVTADSCFRATVASFPGHSQILSHRYGENWYSPQLQDKIWERSRDETRLGQLCIKSQSPIHLPIYRSRAHKNGRLE